MLFSFILSVQMEIPIFITESKVISIRCFRESKFNKDLCYYHTQIVLGQFRSENEILLLFRAVLVKRVNR